VRVRVRVVVRVLDHRVGRSLSIEYEKVDDYAHAHE
jgi:hypothetical protein